MRLGSNDRIVRSGLGGIGDASRRRVVALAAIEHLPYEEGARLEKVLAELRCSCSCRHQAPVG